MATEILRRTGLPEDDACLVAKCLTHVDLRGVFSHGTRQLQRYVHQYQEGELNPRPEIRILQETPVSALFSGEGGLGYLAATRATEAAIRKANESGLATVATRYNGHVGSMGIYARMALPHGLITIGFAGGSDWEAPGDPDATVWDAVKAPPMCFGIPTAGDPPFVFDFNVNMFTDRARLEQAAVEFTDPFLKSLGLKFVSTILGGALAGTMPAGEREYPGANRGFLLIALRPDLVGDAEGFRSEVTRIIASSRSLEPIPGKETAEVPGSLEWQRERDWSLDGIPLPEANRHTLEKVASSLGVSVPW
jgi:LDH2 family malate/lactate/ureidoglycolate dehydrogenase